MAREREHPQPMAAVRATLEEHEGFIIAKIQYVSQDLFINTCIIIIHYYYHIQTIHAFLGSSSHPQTFHVLILTIKKAIHC